jgi:FkbM family methyltransferase
MIPRLKDAFRRRLLAFRGVKEEIGGPVERAGNDRDNWAFCPEGLGADSIVYSIGVGRHIAFDLWLIRRFGLTVDAFDPTPVSIEWVRSQSLPPQFRFHPVGLAAHDGVQKFFLPRSVGSAHFSSVARSAAGGETIDAPVRRLSTLMRERGHAHIDLLKMDIEGGEYGAIEDLCASGIDARQILVEFHHNFATIPMARTVEAVGRLRALGHRVFHVSHRGLEISMRRAA